MKRVFSHLILKFSLFLIQILPYLVQPAVTCKLKTCHSIMRSGQLGHTCVKVPQLRSKTPVSLCYLTERNFYRVTTVR